MARWRSASSTTRPPINAFTAFVARLEALEAELEGQRFLLGDEPQQLCFADLLLFAFLVRLDPVYYGLYKASAHLLRDLPALHGYARDLYELPELASTTDFDAIKAHHYSSHPVLNPRGLVPRGGVPELDAPHFRDERFARTRDPARAVGEDSTKRRAAGEWVRGQSRHRRWISDDGSTELPAEAGRYHLYAPYNCPWSHRALLARSVKGLESVVGATVVYFRRDPDHGWQLNPRVPGCTEDPLYDITYVRELYERVGSEEKSVPVLWDAKTETIVNNESAEILRMFNSGFGALAERADLDLYPEAHRQTIDRLNSLVYQRVNNGAYKAGFARSQFAYERAYARYFAALDWLEARLLERDWLAGSERPTEADLRLLPTLARHDEVYLTRFKLDRCRVSDMPRLAAWLERMQAWPGVSEASCLDHARNGYFGRSGNEIVPAGPSPLALSPADFPREVWQNIAPES